ncbi:MAG: GNAT family N-acetyltransferase [Roseibium sp.]|uniref:GNAT family N-acetyltransferase n=1 Tax=Roseibium sp. TaxID=1936156 RepID=UPI00260AE007|nr:GNAT family N-acetyltransferase [Roseibium sp.]MCV0426243.1 GNAT family N-acetyltransferase [Roseibium sp.]
MTKKPLTLRPLAPADCDLVCRHREEMFRASGHPDQTLADMAETYRDWQRQSLDDGSYFGFVAEVDGHPIGAVGLMEIDWPPHPLHPLAAKRGYVLNLFVEPECRGQGIARKLMQAADGEFKKRGLDYAILHATKQGRPLYEKDGWAQTSEMGKTFLKGHRHE